MLKRASKESLSLRWKVGQFSVWGIMSARASWVRNWHPLQTPRVNVSGRLKKAANCWRSWGFRDTLRAPGADCEVSDLQ